MDSNLSRISYKIATSTGVVIEPEWIAEIPIAKCPYSKTDIECKIYATRTGEILIIAYCYRNGEIKIKVI